MPKSIRSTILERCKNITVKKIKVPEWGANVHVRVLSASQAPVIKLLSEKIESGKFDEAQAMAAWCILGVCDSNGRPLFKESDADALVAGPLTPLANCAEAIMKINGVGDEEWASKKKA